MRGHGELTLGASGVKTLLTADELCMGVDRLAGELNAAHGSRPLVVVGVLGGVFVFLADLVRRLEMPVEIGFLHASSYRGQATSPGELTTDLRWLPDLADRDILLVDDIFDSGLTLNHLRNELHLLEPRSLRTAVLLAKEGRSRVDWRPDHVAFDIPDEFVVGYGLDFDGLYRNRPDLVALEPDDIAAARRREA
jgi:hypoxanthine phosphoribosyltransferase